jgi:hypothetical protein
MQLQWTPNIRDFWEVNSITVVEKERDGFAY